MKKIILSLIALCCAGTLVAQQINTLYFLENAPMRHTLNPAFQPVSNGYLSFPLVGWSNESLSTGGLTYSDFVYRPKGSDKYIFCFNNDQSKQKFLDKLSYFTTPRAYLEIGVLNFGFRLKEKGYIYIGINQKFDMGVSIPHSFFETILGDIQGSRPMDLHQMNSSFQSYTEISGGYSHIINEQFTVGGKLKILLGEAYADASFNKLGVTTSTQQIGINGDATVRVSTTALKLPQANYHGYKEVGDNMNRWFKDVNYMALTRPTGYGATVDLGMTYKPFDHLKISAAIIDLGFIRWNNIQQINAQLDGTFTGVGEVTPDNYKEVGNKVNQEFMKMFDNMYLQTGQGSAFNTLVNGKFNASVEGYFWKNRVAAGVINQLQWYNGHVFDELTIGGRFNPANWFALALSYSLCQNAKFSDFGVGLSLMPYDGINLTFAMDYIPTHYANTRGSNMPDFVYPYKTAGINLGFGISIVWGTNPKQKDKADRKDRKSRKAEAVTEEPATTDTL